MSEHPTLVIVIPTKDRRLLLERALESVRTQTYEPYRVVIINDGSSDDTKSYLDSLSDPRIRVIHHERSRGVNAARNAAFKTLREGEWVVPLDDDDYFLPGAFAAIAGAVMHAPESVQVLLFNTLIRTASGESVGGSRFPKGEPWQDFTYEQAITDVGHSVQGEPRSAFKWTLFPQYLFQEDINGFEGEWWLLVTRDRVGVRFVNTPPIVLIDWQHEGEHLSDTASANDRASFARAHARIFKAHAGFFRTHPREAQKRAFHAFKISILAKNPRLALFFAWKYVRAIVRR